MHWMEAFRKKKLGKMASSSESSQEKTISDLVDVLPEEELIAVSTKEIQRKTDDAAAVAPLIKVGSSRSSKAIVNNGRQAIIEENLSNISSKTCHQISLMGTLMSSKPAGDELNQDDVPVFKKRERKPNSLINFEGTYDYPMVHQKESGAKLGFTRKKAAEAMNVSRNFGLHLIGRRIMVWCPVDHKFYEGNIIAFKAFQKLHQIQYDDDMREILNLSKERWQLIGDEELSNEEQDIGAHPSGLTDMLGNAGTSSSHDPKSKNHDGDKLRASTACLREVSEPRSSELVVHHDGELAGEGLSQENVPVSEKRVRRPNIRLKHEEGYDFSWLCPKEPSLKLGRRNKKVSCATKTLKHCGLELIGRRVKIWWKLDMEFYEGKITSFNNHKRLHQINYDDGETELLDLSKEIWELVDDEELDNVNQDNGLVPSSSTAVVGNFGINSDSRSKRKTKAVGKEVTTHTEPNKKIKVQAIHQKTAAASKMPTSRMSSTRKPLDSSSSIDDGKEQFINVNGYEVDYTLAPILEAIFAKYGDICSASTMKNYKMRCLLLEVICNISKKILSKDFDLVTSEVTEMMSQLSDLAAVKIDVSWLLNHLQEVEKVKEIGQECFHIMDLKSNSKFVVKALEKDMEEGKLKLISARKKYKKAKKHLEVFKLVGTKVDDRVAEYSAVKEAWQKLVDELL